jgi:hypothetical protein
VEKTAEATEPHQEPKNQQNPEQTRQQAEGRQAADQEHERRSFLEATPVSAKAILDEMEEKLDSQKWFLLVRVIDARWVPVGEMEQPEAIGVAEVVRSYPRRRDAKRAFIATPNKYALAVYPEPVERNLPPRYRLGFQQEDSQDFEGAKQMDRALMQALSNGAKITRRDEPKRQAQVADLTEYRRRRDQGLELEP